MKIPVKAQLLLSAGGVALILLGTVTVISGYWLPKMQTARETIQQNAAAVAAIERQQTNLIELGRQLTERQTEQGVLNKEMWAFSTENAFFEIWDSFGRPTAATVTIETIADAIPASTPVRRDAEVTVSGSLADVLATVAKIPTVSPLVTLQKIQISPGQAANTAVARLTVASLWYDDSLH